MLANACNASGVTTLDLMEEAIIRSIDEAQQSFSG